MTINGSADNTFGSIGSINYIYNNNTGSTGFMEGVEVYLSNSSTGTITNVYGTYISLGNSGTITNTYGLYLGDVTAGTQTNQAYGLYQADANARNFFAGNLGIGDSSPAYLFTVGNGDLFGVNSSGAIAAATGITSSGTITFSGLSDGIVKSTSGVLSGGNTVSLTADVSGTLPVGNGGTGATSFTTGGILLGGATLSDTGVLTNGQLLIGDGAGAPAIATLTQGTGITITNGAGSITIANSDLGSSQNIFKTFAVAGQSNIVADSNSDTVTLIAGTNVTITTNATNDEITINAAGGGDITDIGDCSTGACFTGSSGTTLTFDDPDGDQTFSYDTTNNRFAISDDLNIGANSLQGTSAVIDFSSFDVTSTGSTSISPIDANGLSVSSNQISNFTTDVARFNLIPMGPSSGTTLSGDVINAQLTSTLAIAGSGTATISGNIIDATRTITAGSSDVITVSGDLASFVDFCANGSGTCTSTANVISVVQNFTGNSGAALNISSASTNGGLVFRANDDGTLTDSTAFVIDASGNVGIGGDTTPGALVDVANGALTINSSGTVTIAAGQSYTGLGAVTVSSTTNTLTLDSGNNILTIAAGDTTLQRTASGTYTIDLVDGSGTTLAITNSGAGTASLSIDSLAGGGTQCVQVNNSGVLSGTGASCGAGSGDITAVGSMTSGDAFADATADDDWLGLGASAGRIEFDDQTTDEINLLSANVGIGTSTPSSSYKLTVLTTVSQTGAINMLNSSGASIGQLFADAEGDGGFYLANANGNGIVQIDDSGVEFYRKGDGATYVAIEPSGNFGYGSMYFNDSSSVTKTVISAGGVSYFNGGNFGIGDSSPAALLTVGNGDLFQVDSSGNTTLQNQADLRLGDSDGSNYVAFQAPGTVTSNVTWTLPSADASGCFQSNGSGTISISSCGGGSGDITAVGSMTSGDAFADATADDDWLGLGASAGRIEFDDQTTDEVNILGANVGIGTSTPAAKIHINFASGDNLDSMRFSDADVAHGLVGVLPTDTYGAIGVAEPNFGGLSIKGVSSAGNGSPVYITGSFGSSNPVDDTGAITIIGQRNNGSGSASDLADAEAVFKVVNRTTDRFVITGNGSVGVNTTSPSNQLTVNQSADTSDSTFNTYGIALLNQGAQNFSIGSGSGANYMQSWANKPLHINPQGNDIHLVPAGNSEVVIGGSMGTSNAKLVVHATALNNEADNSISILNLTGTAVDKNDALTKTFSGVEIKPTINAGGSNTTTSFNVVNIDTTNTSTTGVTTNLIKASYGGTTQFIVDSSGNTTLNAQADLRLADSDSSNWVAFQAPGTVSSNVTWTLPSADASGCFQSNGSGTISIASCGSGSGDSITVNSSAVTDANFLDVAATGSAAGTTWSLNTGSTPDDITLAISVASGSVAGVVDTNAQTFAGAKTFTSDITVNKADPSIVFNTATATDTDFWMGVVEDAGSDDDDLFQIGDGTTPGTNPFMTINTSGSIGIGTTSGTEKLLIKSASAGSTVLSVQSSTGNPIFNFLDATGNGRMTVLDSSTNIDVEIRADGNSFFNGGNVGIGNTSPSTRLDVTGLTISTDADNTIMAANFTGSITKNNTNTRTFAGLQIKPTLNTGGSNTNTIFNVLNIDTTNTATTGLTTNLIKASYGGLARFNVLASDGTVTLSDTNGDPYIQMHYLGSAGYLGGSIGFGASVSGGNTSDRSIGRTSSGLAISANDLDSSDTVDFFFTGTGRLGIGTSSPSAKLDVRDASGGTTSIFDVHADNGSPYIARFIRDDLTTGQLAFFIDSSGNSIIQNRHATGDMYFSVANGGTPSMVIDETGKVGIGDTTLKTQLHVKGTVTGSGADAIATIYADSTFNNSTASGFQFGQRFLNTISSTVAATHVGTFIRMTDNTSLSTGQLVRGIEVQSYSGTNNNGINTGIASFAKTFGIHAETTAQAGGVAQPAAVFADLNNSADGSIGNAIRAYSDNITSANLVSLYQETSTMTGTGLVMNFAAGSGTFSGNFLDLQKNSTSKFKIDDTGTTTIAVIDADNAKGIVIYTEESSADTVNIFEILSDTTNNSQTADTVKAHFDTDGSLFVSFTGTQTSSAVCHASSGMANNDEIVDCTGTPSADFAEMYPVETGIEAGEVVMLGSQDVNTYDQNNGVVDWNKVKGTVKQLVRADQPYNAGIVGVVSDNYQDFISTGYNIKEQDNPKSIALIGRVLVKVNMQNGDIKPGDYLTVSSVPGVAMKATKPGTVIGQALATYDGTQANNSIMVFVRTSYYDPTILVDANGNLTMQRGESTTTLVANSSNTAMLINQKGSGDLLHLQSNETSRFLVKNNGSINVNAITNGPRDSVISVKANNTEVFNIDASGNVKITGTIFIKDDTFAGSIATNENGEAEITFSNDLGTGKPVIQLTPESNAPVFAQVVEWKKDVDNKYTGFKMKTFGLNGSVTSSVVHYIVTGKQEGYETSGTIQVLNAPTPPPSNSISSTEETTGQVAGESTEPNSVEDVPVEDQETPVSSDANTAEAQIGI